MKLSNNNQTAQAKGVFGRTIFRRFRAATLVLASFLFLTACGETARERAETVGGVTARQVIENPQAYVGKTVTVSGDVEEIWGPRAFNMDSGLSVGELLVVGREPFPNVPDRNNTAYVVSDIATVTGVVRMFVTADIEREIGWDLDSRIEAEFNAKPVLIAQSATFKPNANRSATMPNAGQTAANTDGNQMAANNNANQMTTGNNSNQATTNNNANQTAAGNKLTDTGAYASTADKLTLVGKEAQFANARVVRVVGPRTFTIASGSGEIYVMLDEESAKAIGTQGKIDDGDTLSVNGKFQRLEAAEIKDLSSNRFRALTVPEREFLKNTPVYLQAGKVSGLK